MLSSIARIALSVVVLAIIGNPILLYLIQDRLIFHPLPVNEANRKLIRERYPSVQEVSVASSDGTKLHGWFQRTRKAARAPLIIYFGGNEEDVSYLPARDDRVEGWSLLMVDYRGYGLSEGKPGEEAFFRDALATYDAFARRDDVDAKRVAVMGVSLGSGVATYLAAHRPVHAVVLVTPYDSIASVAADKHLFRLVPVGLILKHRFDSIALAPNVRQPALFMVASEDEMIPVAHAQRLFDAWAGPKQWNLVKGEGHNTIDQSADYWRTIDKFLAIPAGVN
jgi:pimeloyl-ACP methyl ester carboxylesterase